MRKIFLLIASAFLTHAAMAQSIAEQGCGTITSDEEMQPIYEYVRTLQSAKPKGTAGVDSIPLTLHIVTKDDGTGGYPLQNLFPLICNLNTRYAPASMYFYIAWPVRFINNTSYYTHNFTVGYQMMQTNNVTQTANVYFVQDPAGTCGYFSPGADGVAIGINCAAVNSTTLVHELGHFFSLPHTFRGWENGATPPAYQQEYVKRGVGANCTTAGDGFCDTDADYLGSRWACPYNGFNVLLDPLGDTVKPDPTLYMSYSMDACMTRFSPLQIGSMQNNLYGKRNALRLRPSTPYAALSTPNVFLPANKVMYSNTKYVMWNKVPGAQYYYIKITSAALPTVVRQEALTTDTFLNISIAMVNGGNYLATVVPLQEKNVCGAHTAAYTFSYNAALGVDDVTSQQSPLSMVPNPANTETKVQVSGVKKGAYAIRITNIAGQSILQQDLQHPGGTFSIPVSTQYLPNGIYSVRITGNGLSMVEKLVVQH